MLTFKTDILGFENISKEELIDNVKICNTDEDDFFDITYILWKSMGLPSRNVAEFQLRSSKININNSIKLIDSRDKVIYGLLVLCDFPIQVGTPIQSQDSLAAYALNDIKQINGFLFVIDQRLRGCGFDKKMIEFAMDFIKNYDICWIAVDNDLKSHNYWKRFGFTEILNIDEAKFYVKFLNNDCFIDIYKKIKAYFYEYKRNYSRRNWEFVKRK